MSEPPATSDEVLAPAPKPKAQRRKIPRARLELVEQLWLAGHTERSIQRRVSKQWKVTLRTVRRDLARVAKKIAALPPPDPHAERKRVEGMLMDTYRLARVGNIRGPNTTAMTMVATRLAQMSGLLKDVVDHTVRGATDLSKLTPEELEQLETLTRKASER